MEKLNWKVGLSIFGIVVVALLVVTFINNHLTSKAVEKIGKQAADAKKNDEAKKEGLVSGVPITRDLV